MTPKDWGERDGKLYREFVFPDFSSAMKFVNDVADLSEKANHHPDILIHYSKVTLTLWTHTEGKITEKDVLLAEAINALYPRPSRN